MEQTVTGVRCDGGWDDVVRTGERVADALRAANVDDAVIEQWEDWRPRTDEAEADIREKTVEQATLPENAVEQDGGTATGEAGQAVDAVSDSLQQAAAGEMDDAADAGKDAASSLLRAVDTAARKFVRRAEKTVYRHVMARTNPCYFDTAAVSATLAHHRSIRARVRGQEPDFSIAVNVSDEDAFRRFQQRLAA